MKKIILISLFCLCWLEMSGKKHKNIYNIHKVPTLFTLRKIFHIIIIFFLSWRKFLHLFCLILNIAYLANKLLHLSKRIFLNKIFYFFPIKYYSKTHIIMFGTINADIYCLFYCLKSFWSLGNLLFSSVGLLF